MGDYARIERVDAKANQLTVKTDDDRRFSYDPRRLQGVTLYREAERAFAAGDRVQMTAPDRERGVPNRELGTVERVDSKGQMEVRWDSGGRQHSVNQCLAYGGVSPGQYDARIYTDDKTKLARALDRDVPHRSALEQTHPQTARETAPQEISQGESRGQGMAAGLG
jgi:hypothetical protein